ncbi:hypothetical protein JOM56_008584 [Amanita muscaria]
MPPNSTPASARNVAQRPQKQPPADSWDSPTKLSPAGGKPDKKAYDEEQARIKAEIDALQAKLSAVRDKISLTTKSGSGNDRESTLRDEHNDLRAQQSSSKSNRSQVMEKIKSLQENIQKKVKDLQASKGKTSFKTVEDVDAHVRKLEQQVESGTMKLADEKRALQEISNSRRIRRLIESYQAEQQRIDEDRREVDELKKLLDDPELKAISDRFEAITAELNVLKAERDEVNANKSKLFDERDGIQSDLNALFNEKRESAKQYREANDQYWTKVKEDRARRDEKRRAQKKAEEEEKKKELADHLLEEAKIPAYQTEIEDCQTLIDHFSGKSPNSDVTKSSLFQKVQVAGVPQLELRKVEGAPVEGAIVRKKGEETESYFVGRKSKSKGKKNTQTTNDDTNSPATPTSASLHMPLPILSALGGLAVPPPTSSADVLRVIEDLKTKKLWFEANQSRATAEKMEKAEAEIKRLLNKKDDSGTATPLLETPAESEPASLVDNELQAADDTASTALWTDNEPQASDNTERDATSVALWI